jgi:hypothetical protein
LKLTNLNQPITDFSGVALPIIEGKAFTVKAAILNCLGAMRAENGKEAIEVFTVGGLIAQGENGGDLKAEQLRDLQNDVAELREKASSFLSRVEGEMRLLSHISEIQQLADGLQRDGTLPLPVVHAAAQQLLRDLDRVEGRAFEGYLLLRASQSAGRHGSGGRCGDV